jgi:sulfite exporter TauE/SafE
VAEARGFRRDFHSRAFAFVSGEIFIFARSHLGQSAVLLMELASVSTPAAAFVAGLVTSLHCVGMCGPLACWLTPTRLGEDALSVTLVYQAARLASYTLLGAAAGLAGMMPLAWVDASALRFLPWALVLFFVAVALRLDRFLPRIPAFARLARRAQAGLGKRSRLSAAVVLGAAMPLLPCGPLYFLVAIAALSGSAVRGMEFMLAFGCGTLPLLWLAQANFGWLRRRVSPAWISRAQTALAFAAAVIIAWRLRATLGFPGPDPSHWLCH